MGRKGKRRHSGHNAGRNSLPKDYNEQWFKDRGFSVVEAEPLKCENVVQEDDFFDGAFDRCELVRIRLGLRTKPMFFKNYNPTELLAAIFLNDPAQIICGDVFEITFKEKRYIYHIDEPFGVRRLE